MVAKQVAEYSIRVHRVQNFGVLLLFLITIQGI